MDGDQFDPNDITIPSYDFFESDPSLLGGAQSDPKGFPGFPQQELFEAAQQDQQDGSEPKDPTSQPGTPTTMNQSLGSLPDLSSQFESSADQSVVAIEPFPMAQFSDLMNMNEPEKQREFSGELRPDQKPVFPLGQIEIGGGLAQEAFASGMRKEEQGQPERQRRYGGKGPQAIARSSKDIPFLRGQKQERQLYVGNLPVGMPCDQLVQHLNIALLVLKKYLFRPGVPILGAWIAPDGHYGFLEFRNPEEMQLGFALSQVTIRGCPLKVGKTKNSSGLEMSKNEQTRVGRSGESSPSSSASRFGNVLLVFGVEERLFLKEIISQLISDSENPPTAYKIERQSIPLPVPCKGSRSKPEEDPSEKVTFSAYLIFPTREAALFAVQPVLETFGCIVKDSIQLMSDQACEILSDELRMARIEHQNKQGANGASKQRVAAQGSKPMEVPLNGDFVAVQMPQPGSTAVTKSHVVAIENIILFQNMQSEQDYKDLEKDLREQLIKYGDITALYIPRPPYELGPKEMEGSEESEGGEPEPGQIRQTRSFSQAKKMKRQFAAAPEQQMRHFGTYFIASIIESGGTIFAKFDRSHHARRCVEGLHKRKTYLGRVCRAHLVDESHRPIPWGVPPFKE